MFVNNEVVKDGKRYYNFIIYGVKAVPERWMEKKKKLSWLYYFSIFYVVVLSVCIMLFNVQI